MLKCVETSLLRRFALALGFATLLFSAPLAPTTANAQEANEFVVQYDQVRLLRLEEKAATVIVGNPSIADVAIQNGKLLAITGKTFGVTNLIVLDVQGRVMMDRQLMVKANNQKIVNLTRGAKTQTYNCAPGCQPVLKIGDDSEYYSSVASSSANKVKFSAGLARSSGN